MKNIDADKLKAEIKHRINLISNGDAHPEVMKRAEGILKGYNSILSFIDSLQQEHPIQVNTLTWKDINDLERIINNVHYEFRNGMSEKSFGEEVLERFREKRDEMGNLYKAGDFLYKLGDKGIKKESQRVFIYTGQLNADGYGVLLGFDSDGKLRKSTGYGNYQYGNDVRFATEEEIKSFINEVFNYPDVIREYGC